MNVSATAWRDEGAAQREALRTAAAQRGSAAARERFDQRVEEARAQVTAQPTVATQRLLDIRV